MDTIPLSRVPDVLAAYERRTAITQQSKRYEELHGVLLFFDGDRTHSEPLPDHLIEPIRELLISDAHTQLAAIDAELRQLGVDPEA